MEEFCFSVAAVGDAGVELCRGGSCGFKVVFVKFVGDNVKNHFHAEEVSGCDETFETAVSFIVYMVGNAAKRPAGLAGDVTCCMTCSGGDSVAFFADDVVFD